MNKRSSKLINLIKDSSFWQKAWTIPGLLFTLVMAILSFFELEASYNKYLFTFLVILSFIYIITYFTITLRKKEITLNIDGSLIEITSGDIFEQNDCYKVIAFNEFLDTKVDDNIISSSSLNGIYLLKKYPTARSINSFDKRIAKDTRLKKIEEGVSRRHGGKSTRYELGSIFKDNDYFLVAFSKFNEKNEANLRLAEYATCLIRFWDEVNSLYNQKPIALPLLGSGITRHKDFNATNQELLEVILWTFKISKVKFREPSKVKILIRENQIRNVDFNKLRDFENKSI